jgi:hypothetical protein
LTGTSQVGTMRPVWLGSSGLSTPAGTHMSRHSAMVGQAAVNTESSIFLLEMRFPGSLYAEWLTRL